MIKLLEVNNLTICYGTIRALEKVSFYVNSSEIVAMIGPNGAGKSTALNAICGLIPAKEGEIRFQGQNIRGLAPDELVKKGVSLVPEGRRIFLSMTVRENLEMGAFTISRHRKHLTRERLSGVYDLFPILGDRRKQKAGTLSSGEQQMLAIGRALVLEPKLLLLDEPSLGLSPNYVEIVFEKLLEIRTAGKAIIIVEQNASKALQICQRGYVFRNGTIAHEGARERLLEDDQVKINILG